MTEQHPVDTKARPARGSFFQPERYPWACDPTGAQLFVLGVLAAGGPITWWALSR